MLIAHITDPHIGIDPGLLAGRIDPATGLRRALAHVRGLQPSADVLLLTGDFADTGGARDYATVAALLKDWLPARAAGGPLVLAVPGNHDARAAMRQALAHIMPVAAGAPEGLVCIHVEHGGLHFIGLDTQVPGAPHGALGAAQLDWLARQLAACAGQPVLIFMHHPPLLTGIAVMDCCGLLQGRAELGQLVRQHGGVQLIASGHMHRVIAGQLGGAPVVVAPSTSHQVDLDLRPDGALACRLEPPMVGLYLWTASSGASCHFSYVEPFGQPYPI